MTDNQSETTEAPESDSSLEAGPPLDAFAADLAAKVGADKWTAAMGTVHVYVSRDKWVGAATVARDEAKLGFFSWLSAVDWSKEVAVGEPADDVDNLEERYEILCRLSSPDDDSAVILGTEIDKDDAWIDTLIPSSPAPPGMSGNVPRCSVSTSAATPTSSSSTCHRILKVILFASRLRSVPGK